MQPAVVRVRPDVSALHKTFDYSVPERLTGLPAGDRLAVGSRVRVDLHGRRVAGWVTEVDPVPAVDVALSPLRRWSGFGPDRAMIDLAEWAAHRWTGSVARLLRTASPPKNVYRLPAGSVRRYDGEVAAWADQCFADAGAVVRVPPAGDRWPIVLAALARGNPLLLAPTVDTARELAERLRRLHFDVALLPDDWARARAGAVTVGTRSAAFASVKGLGSIVVLDEHDDAYREERSPTWHAREVAIERARRAGVPCVLVSPAPSLEALQALPLRTLDRTVEFAGWSKVQIVDRRDEPPGRLGLFSEEFVRAISPASSVGRVACILNRTGRVRLLACAACGALTTCEQCGASVRQNDDASLECLRCSTQRPPACDGCGSSRLKNLVLGIGRAREELAALLGERVGEVTAAAAVDEDARVVIGTEALLRAPARGAARWRCIAFLDVDQHITALRQRAESEAFALLVMAARLTGSRSLGGRVLVQTRLPDHRVLVAAQRGDPGPLSEALTEQSERMQWPPLVAQAEVSGAAAAAYIELLGTPIGIEVRGPNDDAWLVRAPTVEILTAELGNVSRPPGRLRIAVE